MCADKAHTATRPGHQHHFFHVPSVCLLAVPASRVQTDPPKERYTPGCVCNVGSTETGSLSLERKFVVMSQVTVFSRNGEAEGWDIMSRRSIGSPRSLTSVRFGDVREASFLSESCLSSSRLSKSCPQLMSRQKLDYAENNHPFCLCTRGTTLSLNYTSSTLV